MIEALLDTQPLLWALTGDRRLPSETVAAIDSTPEQFGISDVSLWEMAVKCSIGKLEVPDDLPTVVADLGFSPVTITSRQVWAVRGLPLIHRDPFDRLLIAQARDLDVPVVTGDLVFGEYDVAICW